jgi:hypothetical protein
MKILQITKQIEKRRDAVGMERDRLDVLIGELTDLRENCEEAWGNLQRALDALSEQV